MNNARRPRYTRDTTNIAELDKRESTALPFISTFSVLISRHLLAFIVRRDGDL